jgi:hypothetical protein
MASSGQPRRSALSLSLVLLATVLVVYQLISSLNHGRWENGPPVARDSDSPVDSITLPYDEPDLPPGPHLRDFQIACTTCHSTRLAMTQPAFPKAKWDATVKKMVDAFGAPLTREDQAHAVEYLMAVRGK